MKIKLKFGAIGITLLILLTLRFIVQVVFSIISADILSRIIFIFLSLIYLSAIVGIIARKRWGIIISVVIAGIDMLSALASGGAGGVGAGIADVLILILSYYTWKSWRK